MYPVSGLWNGISSSSIRKEYVLVASIGTGLAVGGWLGALGGGAFYFFGRKMYQNCHCPSTVKAIWLRTFGSVAKTPVPNLPSFIQNDPRWDAFTNYFKEREQQYYIKYSKPQPLFPCGACDTFCPDLEILLGMAYNAKCKDGKLIITIDGKEAVLYRRYADLREMGEGIHYYLEFSLGEEEWIVDPTWKQFAGKTNQKGEYLEGDPYNERLKLDFPDILVAKRDEVFSLMKKLSKQAGSETISKNSQYWEKSHMQDVSSLADNVMEAINYIPPRTSWSDGAYFSTEKWQLFQKLTKNNNPNFVEFSKQALAVD